MSKSKAEIFITVTDVCKEAASLVSGATLEIRDKEQF